MSTKSIVQRFHEAYQSKNSYPLPWHEVSQRDKEMLESPVRTFLASIQPLTEEGLFELLKKHGIYAQFKGPITDYEWAKGKVTALLADLPVVVADESVGTSMNPVSLKLRELQDENAKIKHALSESHAQEMHDELQAKQHENDALRKEVESFKSNQWVLEKVNELTENRAYVDKLEKEIARLRSSPVVVEVTGEHLFLICNGPNWSVANANTKGVWNHYAMLLNEEMKTALREYEKEKSRP